MLFYAIAGGPNPSKVTIILEELGLPYQTSKEDYAKLKQPPFTDINPNGRLPGEFSETFSYNSYPLTDPNTGITLWESNAIISYLVDEYDKDHKISYASSPERHLLQQYSYFQASGQGPYFGQAVWYTCPSLLLFLCFGVAVAL
ncbi:MAG: hypothetical protein LQ340_002631 [Diploschistes diacapsis]|nr:MAG: hypothetical protein LQ340_002631 [Diploschistes diacapsis]